MTATPRDDRIRFVTRADRRIAARDPATVVLHAHPSFPADGRVALAPSSGRNPEAPRPSVAAARYARATRRIRP